MKNELFRLISLRSKEAAKNAYVGVSAGKIATTTASNTLAVVAAANASNTPWGTFEKSVTTLRTQNLVPLSTISAPLADLLRYLKDRNFSVTITNLLTQVNRLFNISGLAAIPTNTTLQNAFVKVREAYYTSLIPGHKASAPEDYVYAVKLIFLLDELRLFKTPPYPYPDEASVKAYFQQAVLIPSEIRQLLESPVSGNTTASTSGGALQTLKILKKAKTEIAISGSKDIQISSVNKNELVFSATKVSKLSTDTKTLFAKAGYSGDNIPVIGFHSFLNNQLTQLNGQQMVEKAPVQSFYANGSTISITDLSKLKPMANLFINQWNTLVKPIGIGELRKVTEEKIRYEVAEIAHIENVMGHEFKERVSSNEESTETTEFSEISRSMSQDNMIRSEQQSSLSKESREASEKSNSFDLGVKVTASYGSFVEVEAETSISRNNSKSASDASVSAHSKSITEEAKKSVSEKVTESRTVRNTIKLVNTNTHRFDNSLKADPVIGVYRWINRVHTAKLYTIGHRFMYELVLPEPALYYKEVIASGVNNGTVLKQPSPPLALDVPSNEYVPLLPSLIDLENYQQLAAEYKVRDMVLPPQENIKVSVSYGSAWDEEKAVKNKELAAESRKRKVYARNEVVEIPDGYIPLHVSGTVTASQILRDYLDKNVLSSKITESDLQTAIDSFFLRGKSAEGTSLLQQTMDSLLSGEYIKITAGSDIVQVKPYMQTQGISLYKWIFSDTLDQANRYVEGNIPVSVLFEGITMGYNIGMEIYCRASEHVMNDWRQKAYDKIMAAYYEQLDAYERQTKKMEQDQMFGLAGGSNPLRNRELVETELKKLCIAFLRKSFPGNFYSPSLRTVNDSTELVYENALKNGNEIKFFEQAFEWENLLYVFYPYYWARPEQWMQQVGQEGNDPLFGKFLRAGASRVVLAVRPGFEDKVANYLRTGQLWNNTSGLVFEDDPYFDIISEIKAIESTPDFTNQKAIDEWEVELPTNMIVLDTPESVSRIESIVIN